MRNVPCGAPNVTICIQDFRDYLADWPWADARQRLSSPAGPVSARQRRKQLVQQVVVDKKPVEDAIKATQAARQAIYDKYK